MVAESTLAVKHLREHSQAERKLTGLKYFVHLSAIY